MMAEAIIPDKDGLLLRQAPQVVCVSIRFSYDFLNSVIEQTTPVTTPRSIQVQSCKSLVSKWHTE